MKTIEEIRRDRLALLIKEAGSQAALSERIDKAPAQISQWLNASINSKTGKPRVMSNAIARELEGKTGKPQGWMDADHSADVKALTTTPSPGAPFIKVPLLANAGSMGTGTDVEHDDVMIGTIALSPDWIAKRIRPSSQDALRFIHAYGDSMSPTMEDGDVALVDTGRRDPSGADGVYVLATDKRVFIKRVTERFNGGHDVTSDNPTVKTVQELNGGSEIRVLGRVLWVWNGRKL